MMQAPTETALRRCMERCEAQYDYLVNKLGCDEDVAADRTYDCLRAAVGEVEHCYDRRDRLFESTLRTTIERNRNA